MTDRAATLGSRLPEKIGNNDDVRTVRPDDYPKEERDDGDVTGASNRGRRANKAGAGGGGNPEDYDFDVQAGGGHKPIRTDNGPKTGADAPVGGSR